MIIYLYTYRAPSLSLSLALSALGLKEVKLIRSCSFLFMRFRPGAEVFSVLFSVRRLGLSLGLGKYCSTFFIVVGGLLVMVFLFSFCGRGDVSCLANR